ARPGKPVPVLSRARHPDARDRRREPAGERAPMTRRGRLLVGAGVIVLALGALIMTGVRQSVVYFVTPSELMAQDRSLGRADRLGGMVVQVSLRQNPAAHDQRFLLTDGKASVPVYHRG